MHAGSRTSAERDRIEMRSITPPRRCSPQACRHGAPAQDELEPLWRCTLCVMKGAWLRRPTKDMVLVHLPKRCLTPARRESYKTWTSKAFPNDNLLLHGPTRSKPRANARTPALVHARARQHSEASEARVCEPPLCPALQPVAFLRLRWAPGARPVDPEPHIRHNLHLSERRSWTPRRALRTSATLACPLWRAHRPHASLRFGWAYTSHSEDWRGHRRSGTKAFRKTRSSPAAQGCRRRCRAGTLCVLRGARDRRDLARAQGGASGAGSDGGPTARSRRQRPPHPLEERPHHLAMR